MYKLIYRIKNGLGEFKNFLETHIHNQGLLAIEKCGEAALNDPRMYVEIVLNIHKNTISLVISAFRNHADLQLALDVWLAVAS